MSSGIYERLVEMIDGAIAAGRYKSRRELFRAAGISSGYLTEMKGRAANGGVTITMDKATKIAAALGVPVTALLPVTDSAPDDDIYPERSWAIIAARALGIPESAVQAVLLEDPGEDPGRLWWFRRIEAEANRSPTAVGKR